MNQNPSEVIKLAQKEHFDGVSGNYTEAVGEAAYRHYVAMTKDALLQELSRYFGDLSGLTGVDVGCGMGNLVAAVGERCRVMHGFDISSGMIEAAKRVHREKPKLRFHAAASDSLSLDDGSVDFAMSVYLLHHLAQDGCR